MKDYHTDVSRDRETALNDAYECCQYTEETLQQMKETSKYFYKDLKRLSDELTLSVKDLYEDMKSFRIEVDEFTDSLVQLMELIEQAQKDDR